MHVKVCSHSLFFKWRLYIISRVSTAGPKAACQGQSGFHCHFRGLIVLARGQWPVFFCPDENLGPTGARGVVMNNIK